MSKTERSSFTVDDRLVLALPFTVGRSGPLEVGGGGEAMGMSCGAGERMCSTSVGEDMGVEDRPGLENHNLARESRHGGTGTWWVEGDTYAEWKSSGASSLLWIHGKRPYLALYSFL
jgi:hypothetical protein